MERTFLNSTCPLLHAAIDLAGMRGERENVQILFEHAVTPGPPASYRIANVTFSALTLAPGHSAATAAAAAGTAIPPSAFSVLQVGFVDTKKTTRYSPSGGGWLADPLLPVDPAAVPLDPEGASTLWLSLDIPAGTAPGVYRGKISVATTVIESGATPSSASPSASPGSDRPITLDVHVTVWGLSLPSPGAMHRDFPEIWSFDIGSVKQLYGPAFDNATKARFYDLMTDSLLPPDHLYKSTPAPFEDYEYLDRTGAHLLNLADIGTDPRGCPSPYTDAQVQAVLDGLAPTVARLDAAGILDRREAYVYGYDEQPRSCEGNIRTLFGAVKKREGGHLDF